MLFHLAAKKLDQVPEDYAECFMILGQARLIPEELALNLSKMARFRNRLVHLYWDIDYGHVYEIICNDLEDLRDFIIEVGKVI